MSTTKKDIEKLKEALEKGAINGRPEDIAAEAVTRLDFASVDTSGWTEFPARFFTAPECKSTIMHVFGDDEARDRDVVCSYFSVVANTPEDAVARLRTDLLKVVADPRIHLYGFLARPSVLKVLMPVKGTPKEIVTQGFIDLGGPKPLAQKFAAFCFLHAEITCGLTPAICNAELGLDTAQREGEIGRDIS